MMERQPVPAPETHEAEPYEPQDFEPRPLAKLGIVFVAAMAIVAGLVIVEQIVLSGLFPDLSPAPPLPSTATGLATPPAPQLQPAPSTDLGKLRAREDQLLSTYGWVDQKTGVTRIPIDRAMELLLQRGLPVRPGGQSFEDSGAQLPGDASSGRMPERVRP